MVLLSLISPKPSMGQSEVHYQSTWSRKTVSQFFVCLQDYVIFYLQITPFFTLVSAFPFFYLEGVTIPEVYIYVSSFARKCLWTTFLLLVTFNPLAPSLVLSKVARCNSLWFCGLGSELVNRLAGGLLGVSDRCT